MKTIPNTFQYESFNRQDYIEAALWLNGMADGFSITDKPTGAKLERLSIMLDKAGKAMCAQGYFGCGGGANCTSDHK